MIRSAIIEALGGGPMVAYGTEITIVVGDCPTGADGEVLYIASHYSNWHVEVHRADWAKYGRKAGPIRNMEMVDSGVDICLAFLMPCIEDNCQRVSPHYSHGATQCADYAESKGILVRRFIA